MFIARSQIAKLAKYLDIWLFGYLAARKNFLKHPIVHVFVVWLVRSIVLIISKSIVCEWLSDKCRYSAVLRLLLDS